MCRDENGYIVVETITSFLLFVLLNLSILSLINIVTVQARVHYALTQAAETISMYAYTLDVMGVAEHLSASADKAETVERKTVATLKDIQAMVDALKSLNFPDAVDSAEKVYQSGEALVGKVQEDPKGVFQMFLNYGVQEGLDALFAPAARELVGHYLSNGTMSGDEFLRAFQVIDGLDGLEFNKAFRLLGEGANTQADSRFLTGDQEVRLVVEYDIDYTFGALPLPFLGKLHIIQAAATRAWMSGVGEGYSE